MGVLSAAPEDADDTPGEITLGAAAEEYLKYPVAFSLAFDQGTKQENFPVTMAHELGHLMSLGHAPCNVKIGVDLAFPHADGKIGSWGIRLLRLYAGSQHVSRRDVLLSSAAVGQLLQLQEGVWIQMAT